MFLQVAIIQLGKRRSVVVRRRSFEPAIESREVLKVVSRERNG
jgi:hypothetical protein